MSRDYLLLLDVAAAPDEVLRDLAAHCSFRLDDEQGWAVADFASVFVGAAQPRNLHLAEPGISKATVLATVIPYPEVDDAIDRAYQVAATLMRLHPGDAAFTSQDARTAVLRLGGTVYLDPGQVRHGRVSDRDFAPAPVVHGMPDEAPVRP